MSNYSQRFLCYHRYISNMVEDCLAVSICLPFTLALLFWGITPLINRFHIFPHGTDRFVWNVGRFIFTLPLYTFKGIGALTIAPLLASILAVRTKEPPSYTYTFILGNALLKLLLKAPSIFLITHSLSFAFKIKSLITVLFIMTLYRKASISIRLWKRFTIGYLLVCAIDSSLKLVAITLSYFVLPAQSLMLLSMPQLLLIGLALALAMLEGQLEIISQLTANLINSLIGTLQIWLLKVNIIIFKKLPIIIPIFKNKKDAASLDEIPVIPYENLFISNSNYAFDLSMLEGNVERTGLQNYNAPREVVGHPLLEWEDVLNLEQVPQLTTRFPKLAKFIQHHKNDFNPDSKRKISSQTIEALRKLAKALLISQSTNPKRFAERITIEKEAFDRYMASLSEPKRTNLENLNLLGGSDPAYSFKEIFRKVFTPKNAGGWCKKSASRLITDTCDRLNIQAKNQQLKAFWQQPSPQFRF